MWTFALEAVRSSLGGTRNAPEKGAARAARVRAMNERLIALRRNAWRQRFLAIARESEVPAGHRRESLDAPRAARTQPGASRSLRGIRLGCLRAA